MDHRARIDAARAAVRYLAERAVTHGTVRVPNTPAWTVAEVSTHTGWALWFWRHMMDAAPDDSTARDRALADTPPFPSGLGANEFLDQVEPVFDHIAADEHAECYVSMAGGPGTRGLWARHAMAEIGVHRMDVEAALSEPHELPVDQAGDAVGYVADFVLPSFRRMAGEDPGSLTLEPTGPQGEILDSHTIGSASERAARVRGPASQMLLALWGRPHHDVEVRDGDQDTWQSWLELPTRTFQFASNDG